ncbi:hypothetical protein OB985_26185 [Bacillus cereus]|nr:hypothetical protein [Bacillus cereus]
MAELKKKRGISLKEYTIHFVACDGYFEIIVNTNHVFKAETDEEAKEVANKLEGQIWGFLNPYFDKDKNDIVIDIVHNEYFDKAFITKFIIDDVEKINKNQFIEELEDEYTEYFIENKILTFESIAYGISDAAISTRKMLEVSEIGDRWINENQEAIEHRTEGIKWADSEQNFLVDTEISNMIWTQKTGEFKQMLLNMNYPKHVIKNWTEKKCEIEVNEWHVSNVSNKFKKNVNHAMDNIRNDIKMIQEDTVISKCPHCDEVLIKYHTTQNLDNYCEVLPNINNNSLEKFIYHDGDTIPVNEEEIMYPYNRFDAELLEGRCPTCTNFYFAINVYISSRPVNNHIDDEKGYYIQANTPTAREIKTFTNKGDIPIISVIYKDTKVEKDPDDSYLDIEEYVIGPFALPTTISGTNGVSIHNNELDIWNTASKLLTCFLNARTETVQ